MLYSRAQQQWTVVINDVLSGNGGSAGKPWNPDLVAQRIKLHRTAAVVLRLINADGSPLKGQKVRVAQVRHKFLFGCYASSITPDSDSDYNRRLVELFNYATLPFYWGLYEGYQNHTDSERLKAIALWCLRNDIVVKGHPLLWHYLVPPWAELVSLDELRNLQLQRIKREVREFSGSIDIWDVVNESVLAPSRKIYPNNPVCELYNRFGRLDLVAEAFAAARCANPSSTLVINDFVTDARYQEVLDGYLTREIPVDAIGIQSHMHKGAWSQRKIWEVCERFARFGKSLHFTELTLVSGAIMSFEDNDLWTIRSNWNSTETGEARQADDVLRIYRILFSHPGVSAITWWDLADDFTYMGAPGGLLRRDMSPKPAYEAMRKLIRQEWWTGPLELIADEQGSVSFRGFLGSYRVESDDGYAEFELTTAGCVELVVKLLR